MLSMMSTVAIVYLFLTYRIWGGYYYHNPHQGPYGYMSQNRRLRQVRLSKKNHRMLLEINGAGDEKQMMFTSVARFLRKHGLDETTDLDEKALLRICADYYRESYQLGDRNFKKGLGEVVGLFFR